MSQKGDTLATRLGTLIGDAVVAKINLGHGSVLAQSCSQDLHQQNSWTTSESRMIRCMKHDSCPFFATCYL